MGQQNTTDTGDDVVAPHAGIESKAGKMIAGPFAAMADRTPDALGGKR
jgi:hypothetical protein